MEQQLATLAAALVGAVLGSLGAVSLRHFLERRTEASQHRRVLVRGYLFQLQDAVESLWFRLHNLAQRSGRVLMNDAYFAATTLYAFGRVLAVERIFTVEGVYAQLEEVYPDLGTYLRQHRLDADLRGLGFHQYDRLTLAEILIEQQDGRARPTSFIEFRRRYGAAPETERDWLVPAQRMIETLDDATMNKLLDSLSRLATRLSQKTNLPTTITRPTGT